MVHVSILPVVIAAVVVFVLGWLWYSPLLFFKPWMRLRGLDPVAAMAGAKMPAGELLVELVGGINLAYVISGFVTLLCIRRWVYSIHFGILLWIGFTFVLLPSTVLWETVPCIVA